MFNENGQTNDERILLSSSVGVGVPQLVRIPYPKIALPYSLETEYRLRYKSDYMSQTGKLRKPRYITDEGGRHFVTVQVRPGLQGTIRLDWLTVTTEQGDRYVMPYKFQASNDSVDVPDCNPMYVPIDADASGIMK